VHWEGNKYHQPVLDISNLDNYLQLGEELLLLEEELLLLLLVEVVVVRG
jgi:hypothetical protein